MPRHEEDLLIAASNSHVLVFDNLSSRTPAVSDELCRLSTGGGLSKRRLFTDSREFRLDAPHPVILNEIPVLVSQPDLLEGAMCVTLAGLSDGKRRSEEEIWTEFEEKAGLIFGALLNALSGALREFDKVSLPRSSRMADFAKWVTAAEPGLGLSAGTFLAAYETVRRTAIYDMIRGGAFSMAIFDLSQRGSWSGTASELLNCLESEIPEKTRRGWPWPSNEEDLKFLLRLRQSILFRSGCYVCFGEGQRGDDRHRVISITAAEEDFFTALLLAEIDDPDKPVRATK
jgi:hypothetical protein